MEASLRTIEALGRRLILGILRDITEPRTHERELERANRLYASLSQVNQAMVRASSPEDLLTSACRALVQSGRFQMAWVGAVDTKTGSIQPKAAFGDVSGYLASAKFSSTVEPIGLGPAGVAIRENRTDVRMLELKEKVNALRARLGEPPPYFAAAKGSEHV